MKVVFDEAVDIVTIRLRDGEYEESDEVAEGVILDFDPEGKVMGIEVLDATHLVGLADRVILGFRQSYLNGMVKNKLCQADL